jgi:hypothetical protein
MKFTEEQNTEIENGLEYLEAFLKERIVEQGWADFEEALIDAKHAELLNSAQTKEVRRIFKAKEEKGYYKFLSSWQQITK